MLSHTHTSETKFHHLLVEILLLNEKYEKEHVKVMKTLKKKKLQRLGKLSSVSRSNQEKSELRIII